jgi:hypothetical protein
LRFRVHARSAWVVHEQRACLFDRQRGGEIVKTVAQRATSFRHVAKIAKAHRLLEGIRAVESPPQEVSA